METPVGATVSEFASQSQNPGERRRLRGLIVHLWLRLNVKTAVDPPPSPFPPPPALELFTYL